MQNETQRVDVIIQLQKMIDMMSRAQGASVKEICRELEVNERTFYRRKDDLEKMDVPLISKGDPDAATSGKRWYIKTRNTQISSIFLTPAEKMLLRKMLSSRTNSTEMEQNLVEKINKFLLHDVNDKNFLFKEGSTDQTEIINDSDNFTLTSNSIELKTPIMVRASFEKEDVFGCTDEFDITEQHLWIYFEPYTFSQNQDKLYVVGRCKMKETDDDKDSRILALYFNKIIEIKQLNTEHFTLPEGYEPSKIINELFTSKGTTRITIVCSHEQAEEFFYQNWFTRPDIGYFFDRQQLSFETDDIETTKKWLLSLGKDVKIISPKSLQDELYQNLSLAKMQYENVSPKIKPFTTLKKLYKPEEYENAISYGITKSNAPLYKYFHTWWRKIFRLEENENYKPFFSIPGTDFADPLQFYKPEDEKNLYQHYFFSMPSYYSFVVYKDFVALEVPYINEIEEEDDHIHKLYDEMLENWTTKPGYLNYISNRSPAVHNEIENYQNKKPVLILTGIEKIDERIAKEISESGTFEGIPCIALVFKRESPSEGAISDSESAQAEGMLVTADVYMKK